MYAVRGLAVPFFGFQRQADVDAADHEHIILEFNFAYRIGHEPLVRGIYLTRFQRASQSSGQSTGRSSHNVVQGGGVGLRDRRRNLIMLCDLAMYAEDYWLRFGWDISSSNGSLHALDAHVRAVSDIGHDFRIVSRNRVPLAARET